MVRLRRSGIIVKPRPTSQIRDYGLLSVLQRGGSGGSAGSAPPQQPAGQQPTQLPDFSGFPEAPTFPIESTRSQLYGVPDWSAAWDAFQAQKPQGWQQRRFTPQGPTPVDDAVAEARRAWEQQFQMLADMQNSSLAATEQDYALWQQELQLREAILDGDAAEAQRLLDAIVAARQASNAAYGKYRQMVEPVNQASIQASQRIYEQAKPALSDIYASEVAGQDAAFLRAGKTVSDTAQQIGSGSPAEQEALAQATENSLLFYGDATERAYFADRIMQAVENAAVADRVASASLDRWRTDRKQELTDTQYAGDVAAQQRNIEKMNLNRQLFELDKQRSEAEFQRAREEALQVGDLPQMDAIGFGQLSAEQRLFDGVQELGLASDRYQVLRGVLKEAWSDGVFDKDQLFNWLGTVVAEDAAGNPVDRASTIGWPPLSRSEVELLMSAMTAYTSGRDSWGKSPKGGYGSAQRRGSEAPNNRANAADARAGAGVYGRRAAYAKQVGAQLEQMFGVRVTGQWRDLSAKVEGGRSANSDHYSGGALDLSGSKAQMKAVAEYLQTLPTVSFVKWWGNEPKYHSDHVHVSFLLPTGG